MASSGGASSAPGPPPPTPPPPRNPDRAALTWPASAPRAAPACADLAADGTYRLRKPALRHQVEHGDPQVAGLDARVPRKRVHVCNVLPPLVAVLPARHGHDLGCQEHLWTRQRARPPNPSISSDKPPSMTCPIIGSPAGTNPRASWRRAGLHRPSNQRTWQTCRTAASWPPLPLPAASARPCCSTRPCGMPHPRTRSSRATAPCLQEQSRGRPRYPRRPQSGTRGRCPWIQCTRGACKAVPRVDRRVDGPSAEQARGLGRLRELSASCPSQGGAPHLLD